MASVFHPAVRGGWRDPDPPVATPGVVLALRQRVGSISGTTQLVPPLRPRIAPHYVTGTEDAYLTDLRIASSGDVNLGIQTRTGAAVNLTAAARAALILLVRVGANELEIRLSTVADTVSPYAFNNADADDWALAVATSESAIVQIALVDGTVANVAGAEVNDPEPRYVPFAPVAEPLSMFDEAAANAPGLVWRHTRRTLTPAAAPVAVVDASRPAAIPYADVPIDPAYVGGGAAAFVTRLDFAPLEVRLTVQGSPTDPRSLSSGRTLDLEFLALAVRPRGAGNVRWSVELGDFEPEPGDVPGVYIFRTAVPLIVRSALPVGAAVACLVDVRSPNVDLGNFQFRRLAGVEDDYRIELLSASVGVRTRARVSHRRAADTEIDIEHTAEEDVRMTARVTRAPYTGALPSVLPTSIQVREIPSTGRYRQRRWVDHSDDFESLSWTRAIGSIGTAQGTITLRDWPRGVYQGAAAPEFIGRAISQRFLTNGDVALTFMRGDAASHMRPGDAALIDGVTTSPADVRAEYEVISRSPRGAQSFSVFDGGDVGGSSVSGIRIQESGQALSGRLELGGVDVLGVSVDAVTLFSTAIAIDVSGATIPELQDFVDRHTVFVRAGGLTWGVPLSGASVTTPRILATIPETDRGAILGVTSAIVFDLSFALVETEDAAGTPNARLNLGRREIVLLDGDSLFTAVEPAAPGATEFAGLIARTEVTVASATLPITLSDLSSRFQAAPGRWVSGIRLVAGGLVEIDVQDRYGRAAAFTADDVERLSVFARASAAAHRFQLSDGTYSNGTYTIGGSTALRDQILFELNFHPTGRSTVTTLLVDTSYYTLAPSGLALAGNDGDWFELALRPGLVPRSRTVRYAVTLPAVRDALSVFDAAAASDLRGQFLAVDPVGDGTVESVSGVLLIQNDTVGFADLNDGTSYIHRLLIAYAPQASGPNVGRHQIAIIFSSTPGATSPATPPDDAALDGLVLAFRFRRGTAETVIQYEVDTSDAARDAMGEQAILDHVDLGGWDNASAPDDFDLAIVDPGRGYTAADQTLPGTAIPFPRVAFAPARFNAPWVPRDGSEFRILLNLWPPQVSAITTPAPNRVRLAVPGATQLLARQAASIPGHPVVAWREFRNAPGVQDLTEGATSPVLAGTEDVAGTFEGGVWRFTTPNGSDVAIQEISIGPGGTSIAFEPGGEFNGADLASLALVIRFGVGIAAQIDRGILLSEFNAQNPIQLAAAVPSWRAAAIAAFTARARVRIAFVDVTVPGVNRMDWTFGHAHTGDLPPLSQNDQIIITDGIALLDGSDPRETPLQIITANPGPASRWIEADAPGGIVALGARATWQRGIDPRPTFGGWWINPRAEYKRGGPGKQTIKVTAQDYSAVLDRRLHGGGILTSRDGETVGEVIIRLLEQWQNDLPFASDEGLVADVDADLGGVVDPPFSTEEAGGTRNSWRQILEALVERAKGTAGYHVDPGKRLVWREHGVYRGLTLAAGTDYQRLTITEDRARSRNVVDVRSEPESTILVSADDPEAIAERARIEGGTGRYEIVSDSPEGNAVGEVAARQHAEDSLARYPFVYRCTVEAFTDDHLPYAQVIRLFEARPGDVFRLSGPNLPALPDVRTTIIGSDVLYVEPAGGGALPVSVVPGALIQIAGAVYPVVGGGGPRGSVWCEVPAGVTAAPSASTPAALIERWLLETIKIEVLRSRDGFVLRWTLTGMRPRVGVSVGRSQTGYVGQWVELIRGAAR